jgi:hypothetical protein
MSAKIGPHFPLLDFTCFLARRYRGYPFFHPHNTIAVSCTAASVKCQRPADIIPGCSVAPPPGGRMVGTVSSMVAKIDHIACFGSGVIRSERGKPSALFLFKGKTDIVFRVAGIGQFCGKIVSPVTEIHLREFADRFPGRWGTIGQPTGFRPRRRSSTWRIVPIDPGRPPLGVGPALLRDCHEARSAGKPPGDQDA